MQLEQLRIFLAVAERKSFTAAARNLYISHSTTCRRVAALEEELGVRLFLRDSRCVHLTPAGEALLREAPAFLRHAEELVCSVQAAGEDEDISQTTISEVR